MGFLPKKDSFCPLEDDQLIHNWVHPAYTYNTNGRRYFLWTMQ